MTPIPIYEVVFINEETHDTEGQAGAFLSRSEAEKVLAVIRREGHTQEMAINIVPLCRGVEQWIDDR